METVKKIKELFNKFMVDVEKAENKNNLSATKRARKFLQEIKELIPEARKEILNVSKTKKNKS